VVIGKGRKRERKVDKETMLDAK